MAWDYSLHGRHAQEFPEKCETCHHVFDEAAQKRVYLKGAEESCAVCHLERDEGKKLSLRNASHTACVGCHLRRLDGGQTSGPTLCVGCHDAQLVARLRAARGSAAARFAASRIGAGSVPREPGPAWWPSTTPATRRSAELLLGLPPPVAEALQ